jgi:hypothetical protein
MTDGAFWLVNIGLVSLGLALIVWANPMSVRYNA